MTAFDDLRFSCKFTAKFLYFLDITINAFHKHPLQGHPSSTIAPQLGCHGCFVWLRAELGAESLTIPPRLGDTWHTPRWTR